MVRGPHRPRSLPARGSDARHGFLILSDAPPLSIAYVGVPLAGRTTSLAYALTAMGQPADWSSTYRAPPRRFVLDGTPVEAGVAFVRAGVRYEDPNQPTAAYLEELAWLLRVDGLIFVADAQHERLDANEAHLASLSVDFAARGRPLDTLPIVFSANKRELIEPWEAALLRERLWTKRSAFVETSAVTGVGVLASLRLLVGMIQAPSPDGSG